VFTGLCAQAFHVGCQCRSLDTLPGGRVSQFCSVILGYCSLQIQLVSIVRLAHCLDTKDNVQNWENPSALEGYQEPLHCSRLERLRGTIQVNTRLARLTAEKLWLHSSPKLR